MLELLARLVVGIGGHGHQPLAEAGVHAVEDPPVDRVGDPAGRLGLEQVTNLLVMAGEVSLGAGQDGVEELGVVASGDDDPQGPPGQWRHLDGIYRPGQFGGEDALDVLIAEVLGHRDDQVRRAAGETVGVGLVGQPGTQAGNQARGADPVGEDVGAEEVFLDELAEGGRELVLALDDQRGVGYRQAQGMTEEGGHREPVGHAADHGGLRAGLHVAEQDAVGTGHGHGHEQHRDPREESGGPPSRGGQAAGPLRRRLSPRRGYRRGGHRCGRSHLAAPGQSAVQGGNGNQARHRSGRRRDHDLS